MDSSRVTLAAAQSGWCSDGAHTIRDQRLAPALGTTVQPSAASFAVAISLALLVIHI